MHRATGEKGMTAQRITILATDGSMPIDYEAEGLLYPDNHVEQTGTWKRADGGTDDANNDYGAIDIHAIRTENGAEYHLDAATMRLKAGIVDILNATEHDIESLIEEALNAACLAIQDRIGQTDGGTAGMYFSGKNRDDFDTLFRQYIESERLYRESAQG
jgi:hypothetical protein